MPPSKGKRRPQQQPAASPQPSPRTPSSHSARDPSVRSCGSGGGGDGKGGVDLPSIAAAAAARFPALVPHGGDGCFAGVVAEVAPRSGSGGAGFGRLWLSEASMVGAGMRPGCLVSVSSCLAPLLRLCLSSLTFELSVSANCFCELLYLRHSYNQFNCSSIDTARIGSCNRTLLLKLVFVL